ncbi:hypothetical protein GCM10023330_19390 [Litoribaculum gwangyangense]|uniref:SPOR domain-containing protein n=2 Tax=Litoribaculum gwangyangense TaxID=1130722 RepID=A0ABP9CK99_9FLAO
MSVMGQRLVYPGQNQINHYMEDPSYLALNGQYNMTGIIQASDTDISNTTQYVYAQLSPFDNAAFGLDYARHSYQVFRYSQIFLNSRFRFNLGNEFHYINLGASIGTDRLNEDRTSKENNINTIFRLGLHYTNFNLTIGGFMNELPVQNNLLNTSLDPLTTYNGYTTYLSYMIRVSDNFRLTPTARYNSYSDLTFFEGVMNLNYKGNYELAISYKNDYSVNAAVSGRFLKHIRVSYSFENAIGSQNFNNVHSVGVSVDLTPKENEIPEWLANVKRNRVKLNSIKKVKEDPVALVETETIEKAETDNIEKIEETISAEEAELAKYPIMTEDAPSDIIDNRLKPGYYIILGSYKQVENAEREIERLRKNGSYARYGKKDANDDFNYVYVDRYDNKDIASKRTRAKQKENGFERVWLLKID